MLAALGEMFALSEQLLPEVAGHHGSAVPIDPVSEVLAGEADPGSLPVAKLTIVNVIPFLHHRLIDSTAVLIRPAGSGQVASGKFRISARRNALLGRFGS